MNKMYCLDSQKWNFCLYVALCLILGFLFPGCDNRPARSADEVSAPLITAPKEFEPPSVDLPGSRVTDYDSLRDVLMEIMMQNPEERRLALWYGNKKEWHDQIGSFDNLQTYIQYIYEEQEHKGDMKTAAFIKMGRGRLFYLNAQYPEAIEQFKKMLEISTTHDEPASVGWAYVNLSLSFLMLGEHEEAEQHLDRATEIAEEVNSEGLKVVALSVKPSLLTVIGRESEARPIYKELIERSNKLGLIELESLARLNLSYDHILAKDFDEAIRLLKENFTLPHNNGSASMAVRNLNLYEAYLGKEEYEVAYQYLVAGSRMSDEIDYASGRLFSMRSMAEYHERKKEYKPALEFFKKYYALSKEQTGEKAQKESKALKAQIKVQNQAWEIERLTQAEQEREFQYQLLLNRLLAVFITVSLVFLLFYLLQKSKARTNHANQSRQIAETKLQVLQSQINPHFVFNAITGIQNSILKSETIDAYNYLGKFSDILRIMAKTATSISIDLHQEIDLIENYLALEKLRFREGFVYDVEVSPDLKKTERKVPGMLVQPVVENAIIHGVSNLSYQGEIHVSFQESGSGVEVIVSDNGRGREAASSIARKEADKHMSIATENANNTLNALQALGYENADITTLDLFNKDGTSAGTKVTIFLPFLKLTNTM